MSTISSSRGSSSATLQQPLPLATRIFLDCLAIEIDQRGNGLTDDDLWTAQQRLRGVPIETLRRWLDVRTTNVEQRGQPTSIQQGPTIQPGPSSTTSTGKNRHDKNQLTRPTVGSSAPHEPQPHSTIGRQPQHPSRADQAKQNEKKARHRPPAPSEIGSSQASPEKKIPLQERNPTWFRKFQQKRNERNGRRIHSSQERDSPPRKTSGGTKRHGSGAPPSQQLGTRKDQPIEILSPKVDAPNCRTRKKTPFRIALTSDSGSELALESDYTNGPAAAQFRSSIDKPTKEPGAKLNKPITAAKPTKPAKSNKPMTAAKPIKPAKSNKPMTAAKPTKPANSNKPITAAKPTKLTKSNKPMTAVKPANAMWEAATPNKPGRKSVRTTKQVMAGGRRSLIDIDETDGKPDSDSDDDSLAEYTPRTRQILSGILPPPKETRNERPMQSLHAPVIAIDDFPDTDETDGKPDSDSDDDSLAEYTPRTRQILSGVLLPPKETRNERPKQSLHAPAIRIDDFPKQVAVIKYPSKLTEDLSELKTGGQPGPAIAGETDIVMEDTATGGDDDIVMEDTATGGDDDIMEHSTANGGDDTMEHAAVDANDDPRDQVAISDLVHINGCAGLVRNTIANANFAADRDSHANEIAETIGSFGKETVSDMISRLYRSTAKFFTKAKGVSEKRFLPNSEQTHAQQLKVWKERREEQIQAAKVAKERVLRNPRRERIKRERVNLRSALGPYWRGRREGGKTRPFPKLTNSGRKA